MDTNIVVLVGNLTKDIEIRMTPSGKKNTRFTLACNRNKESVDFISCIAWEKTAELLEKYCSKGSKLLVNGRIITGNYTDKTGKTVYTTDVLATSIQFLSRKEEGTQTYQGNSYQENTNDFNYGGIQLADDDLPF